MVTAIGLDLAGLDLAGRVGGLVAQDIDLTAQKVGHRRAGALVGHGRHRHVQRRLKQHAAEMRGRADAGIGEGDVLLLRLDRLDQLGDRVGREVGPGDDGHRHVGDQPDAGEVLGRIVGELAVERGAGRLADMVQQQRVAVGVGLGDPAGAERAAGAADILDDHLLAQRPRHRLGDQTGHGVGRAAGGEGHDDGDRAGRIIGLRGGRAGEEGKGRGDQGQSAHSCLSLPLIGRGASGPYGMGAALIVWGWGWGRDGWRGRVSRCGRRMPPRRAPIWRVHP